MDMAELLEENSDLIKLLDRYSNARFTNKSDILTRSTLNEETFEAVKSFKSKLEQAFQKAGKPWSSEIVDNIWSFGPKRTGPNILVNKVDGYRRPSIWSCVTQGIKASDGAGLRDYDSSVIGGFQLATQAGPMCQEPVRGVCYNVEAWDFHVRTRLDSEHPTSTADEEASELADTLSNTVTADEEKLSKDTVDVNIVESDKKDLGKEEAGTEANHTGCPVIETVGSSNLKLPEKNRNSLTGQVMYCTSEGCRRAFQSQPQRIVAAMYTCNIQSTADVLGM